MKSIQNISIVGSGNVAHHMAKALAKTVEIQEIVGRKSSERLKNLAKTVGAKPTIQIDCLDYSVDCILLCVSDDAIAEVTEKLKDFKGILAHTSGSIGLDYGTQNRLGYFYPLQTFRISQPLDISETPFFIGAKQPEDEEMLFELAQKISNSVHLISTKQKQYLHLSAVIVNNFVNHLFGLTNDVLQDIDLDFNLLMPIIQTTIRNAMANNPHDIQTGPAIRGDEKTIKTHLQLLDEFPPIQTIYEQLSDSIRLKQK